MTEVLLIVGVFVFFISVYGAVLVGGHLLEQLEQAGQTPAARPQNQHDEHPVTGPDAQAHDESSADLLNREFLPHEETARPPDSMLGQSGNGGQA